MREKCSIGAVSSQHSAISLISEQVHLEFYKQFLYYTCNYSRKRNRNWILICYHRSTISRRDVVFAFLVSSALWNAEAIPPGSTERQKKTQNSVYSVSRTTLSLAEGECAVNKIILTAYISCKTFIIKGGGTSRENKKSY